MLLTTRIGTIAKNRNYISVKSRNNGKKYIMIIQIKNQIQKRKVDNWIKYPDYLKSEKQNHTELVKVKNIFLLGILIYRKITVITHGL